MSRSFKKHVYRGKIKKAVNFSNACHNHGGCENCKNTRTYRSRKALLSAVVDFKNWSENKEGVSDVE